MWEQLFNERVDGSASLHQHHDPPWLLELGAELLDRVSTDNVRPRRFICEEAIDLLSGAVVCADLLGTYVPAVLGIGHNTAQLCEDMQEKVLHGATFLDVTAHF